MTLIEIVVVVSVIGILAVVMGFEFQGWAAKYSIESQAKEMHMDLIQTRTRAMQTNLIHFAVVTQNDYQIVEDTNGSGTRNTGDTAIWSAPKKLHYESTANVNVLIDAKGLVSSTAPSIRFDIADHNPDYDCIALSTTRINAGKWGDCDNNGVTPNECCPK